jgi:hypothetical protein
LYTLGVLLLTLTAVPAPQPSLAASAHAPAVPLLMSRATTIWGRFPISDHTPGAIERMTRRIGPSRLVRVRARQGTFLGHIAEVSADGLASLTPDPAHGWSGPVDVLRWDDIESIEVRRRSPLRASAAGAGVGAVLGATGGLVDAKVNGGDDLMKMFFLGLAGGLVGAPTGLLIGSFVPLWEPLYHAP